MTEHLLIMRFSSLGDVAMTVPVVDSLARQYPDLRITMLSRGYARPFFERMPENVGFMEADFNGEYQGLGGLNTLYRRLVAKNFTAVADFHGVLRSEYLYTRFKLDRYNVARIDKHRRGRKRLVRASNKKLTPQPTPFRNYSDVLYRLGYPVKIDFKSIFPAEGGDLSLLPPSIGEKASRSERWIGVAPFAAHAGKIYPERLMEQVIAQLIDHHPGCRVFLFGGGAAELETLARWKAKFKECVTASETLGDLGRELVLMSHLDVMISMDSANMHLASMVGTPVVSVWGATHPYAGFMGWGQSPDNAVQLDLPCRPCSVFGNKPCLRGDYSCLKNISPELIVEKAETVMRLRREAEAAAET